MKDLYPELHKEFLIIKWPNCTPRSVALTFYFTFITTNWRSPFLTRRGIIRMRAGQICYSSSWTRHYYCIENTKLYANLQFWSKNREGSKNAINRWLLKQGYSIRLGKKPLLISPDFNKIWIAVFFFVLIIAPLLSKLLQFSCTSFIMGLIVLGHPAPANIFPRSPVTSNVAWNLLAPFLHPD